MTQIVVKVSHGCGACASAGKVNTVFRFSGTFTFAQKFQMRSFVERDFVGQYHDQLRTGEFCLRRSSVSFPDKGDGPGKILCQGKGVVQPAHGGKLQGEFLSGCCGSRRSDSRLAEMKLAHAVDPVNDLKRFCPLREQDRLLIVLVGVGKFDGVDLEEETLGFPVLPCRFRKRLNDKAGASGTFDLSFVLEREVVKSTLVIGKIDHFPPCS